ncbi:MAG: Asp23/Gls24 family envelope stress response protein [Coriobacteriales bacterium]|jgi:uncharacterized alkaline shock family protein YloU
MAETIPGGLSVANDVIADMAGYAALESYGVVGMASPTLSDGIAKLLPASRLRRGIKVTMTENGVHLDLYIIVEHGTNLTEVSRMLAEKVQFVLEDSAQIHVDGVDIHVQGVKVRD